MFYIVAQTFPSQLNEKTFSITLAKGTFPGMLSTPMRALDVLMFFYDLMLLRETIPGKDTTYGNIAHLHDEMNVEMSSR